MTEASGNSEKAVEFLMALPNGLRAAVKQYCAPDLTWWAPGIGQIEHNLAFFEDNLSTNLEQPLTFKVTGITDGGDRIAAETECMGKLRNGKIYANKYHFLLIFEDGKIVTVKEYNDTLHVKEVWGDLA